MKLTNLLYGTTPINLKEILQFNAKLVLFLEHVLQNTIVTDSLMLPLNWMTI
jgi:hypothetical protein